MRNGTRALRTGAGIAAGATVVTAVGAGVSTRIFNDARLASGVASTRWC
ncbi:hypothetical protein ACFVUW_07110 [Streptomyces xiamenensis]